MTYILTRLLWQQVKSGNVGDEHRSGENNHEAVAVIQVLDQEEGSGGSEKWTDSAYILKGTLPELLMEEREESSRMAVWPDHFKLLVRFFMIRN